MKQGKPEAITMVRGDGIVKFQDICQTAKIIDKIEYLFSVLQCKYTDSTSLEQGVKYGRQGRDDTGYTPVSLNTDYLSLNPAEGLCRLSVFVSSRPVKSDHDIVQGRLPPFVSALAIKLLGLLGQRPDDNWGQGAYWFRKRLPQTNDQLSGAPSP